MTVQEIHHTFHTTFARRILKLFHQAVKTYRLIQPGDKIAVCISGGKDSMLLALLLQDFQKMFSCDLVFLSMDPGYSPKTRAALLRIAHRLSLPLEIFETDILRVVERHAAAHPCFLCAKMRRGYLYTEAQKRGCNKIALGHHYNDITETILMSLLYGGQIQTMLPRVQAEHYPGMELIRPLYHIREQSIQDWADQCGLTFPSCSCPAQQKGDSRRAAVRVLLASLSVDNPQIEANLFHAVQNVNTAGLLGWRDQNGKHCFLDAFSEKEKR